MAVRTSGRRAPFSPCGSDVRPMDDQPKQTETRLGYRGPLLSVAELLDELISEGRSRPQACADVILATEDGAITWIDPHLNPRASEEVVKAITQVIQSYMNWRPNTRAPIIPLPGSVNYVQALRVMRTQCEVVF